MADDHHQKIAISSSAHPLPSSEAGLFGRLFKRGKAARKHSRLLSRWSIGGGEHYISIPPEQPIDINDDDDDKGTPGDNTAAAAVIDGAGKTPPAAAQRPNTAPGLRTGAASPQPAPAPAPPNADTGVSSGSGRASTSDPPMLSRKPTLRARLRFRASSNPHGEAQAAPCTTIYVPTHAASDFSRMLISPRLANGLDGHGIAPSRRLEPIKSAEDIVDDGDIRGAARLLNMDDDDDEGAILNDSRAAAELEAKAAAPPIEAHHRPAQRSLDISRQTAFQDGTVPDAAHQQVVDQSPSDFQLFLAQAEAEDRAQRIQIWRSISSASRGPPLNPFYRQPGPPAPPPPPALDEIPEAEPRISNGTTAVASRPKRDNSYAARFGKRATWDSACSGNYKYDGGATATATAALKPSLGGGSGGPGGRTRASCDAPASRPAAAAAAATTNNTPRASPGTHCDSRQPRGLTRQSSLVKKVADYIRPPRDESKTGSRVSTKADS